LGLWRRFAETRKWAKGVALSGVMAAAKTATSASCVLRVEHFLSWEAWLRGGWALSAIYRISFCCHYISVISLSAKMAYRAEGGISLRGIIDIILYREDAMDATPSFSGAISLTHQNEQRCHLSFMTAAFFARHQNIACGIFVAGSYRIARAYHQSQWCREKGIGAGGVAAKHIGAMGALFGVICPLSVSVV